MTGIVECLYRGDVVHTRVRPLRHKLRYRVFALLVDCGALDRLDGRLRLFSHNRFNLFGLYDADHGEGTALGAYLDGLARRMGLGGTVTRFMMLCYPRILGYAFNPLTVYYGLDAADRVRLTIYEVNNTFGERQTYVLPADQPGEGPIAQTCRKNMHVSPFNGTEGTYLFRMAPPLAEVTVGVALREPDGPVLKAHFRGRREALTDGALLRALAGTGWMTAKVTAAIHYEALKLWLKGLRVRVRPDAPARAIAFCPQPEEASRR